MSSTTCAGWTNRLPMFACFLVGKRSCCIGLSQATQQAVEASCTRKSSKCLLVKPASRRCRQQRNEGAPSIHCGKRGSNRGGGSSIQVDMVLA